MSTGSDQSHRRGSLDSFGPSYPCPPESHQHHQHSASQSQFLNAAVSVHDSSFAAVFIIDCLYDPRRTHKQSCYLYYVLQPHLVCVPLSTGNDPSHRRGSLDSFSPSYPCPPESHQHHRHAGSSEPFLQRCDLYPWFVLRSRVRSHPASLCSPIRGATDKLGDYNRLPVRFTARP